MTPAGACGLTSTLRAIPQTFNRRRGGRFASHVRAAYRSGLEERLAEQIRKAGHDGQFEAWKIRFSQPAKERTYTPDFTLDNGIVIESKGMFVPEDRNKMVWVRDQHPGLDIRLVFSNANAKLYKGSKTTYATWAETNRFPWAHKTIPPEWLTEKPCPAKLAAIKSAKREGKSHGKSKGAA